MIAMFFTNCQRDYEDIPLESRLEDFPFTSKLVTESEYLQNQQLVNRLAGFISLKEGRSDITKEYYDAQNDITVHTDAAKYIEYADGTLHSYTFKISRTGASNIENLTLALNPDTNVYDAYLVQYVLNDTQMAELLNHNHISTSFGVNIAKLEGDFTSLLNESTAEPCEYTFTTYHTIPNGTTYHYEPDDTCNHLPNSPGGSCFVYTVIEINCPDDVPNIDPNDVNAPIQNDPTDPNSNGLNGGGNSGNSDPSSSALAGDPDLVTQPFVDLNEQQIKQRLMDYSNDDTINAKMIEYRTKIPTDRKEIGARFKLLPSGTFGAREATIRNGASVSYSPPYLTGEIVSLHIHVNEADVELDDGTVLSDVIPSPMYSNGDILEFFENVNFVNEQEKEKVTSFLITREGTFALIVNNATQANNAGNIIEQSDYEYNMFLRAFDLLVFKNSEGISDSDYVKRVVDFINRYPINNQSMGISVYQAVIDSDGNTITDWRKL